MKNKPEKSTSKKAIGTFADGHTIPVESCYDEE